MFKCRINFLPGKAGLRTEKRQAGDLRAGFGKLDAACARGRLQAHGGEGARCCGVSGSCRDEMGPPFPSLLTTPQKGVTPCEAICRKTLEGVRGRVLP